MKIPPPNYTQTPNDLFDHWLPHLKEGELKVLLVIMRKTFGFHRERDWICMSQMEKLTGMSKSNISSATKTLQEKGIIIKILEGEIGEQKTYYQLVIEGFSNNCYPSKICTPPVQNLHPTGSKFDPTKETLTKENIQKKQQQAASPAAAASSEKKKEQQLPGNMASKSVNAPHIYPCLAEVDIPTADKIEITSRHDENIVKNALAWATMNESKIKTTYIAFLKMACQKGLKPQKPKLSVYEELCQHFKDEEKYNEATCLLNRNGIAFYRGITQYQMEFDDFFSWEKFGQLCKNFGIKFQRKIGEK